MNRSFSRMLHLDVSCELPLESMTTLLDSLSPAPRAPQVEVEVALEGVHDHFPAAFELS
jgi:hypothetical protein